MSNTSPHKAPVVFPIGLTLSGGGYRASAFHLGTIAYLQHLNLLSKTKMLSTVSGGTFTGAKYVLSLTENIPFTKFFHDYYLFLKDTNLIQLGLNYLGQKLNSTSFKRRNLIVAAAQVYSEKLLPKKNGDPFDFGTILNADIHLQEIIFNATEFRNGLAFRFQCSTNPKAKFGNGKLIIPISDAAKIRVADIVAASSCFPGGFEPLAFPDDFVWPDGKVPEGVAKAVDKLSINQGRPVALMDGGIYDNQGLESLLYADDRSEENLGTLIISDTDQKNANLYDFPQDKKGSQLTLGLLNLFARILTICCLLTVVSISYLIWDKISTGTLTFFWDFFLYLIPLILASATGWFIYTVRKLIYNRILPLIPQVGQEAWTEFKRLTLDQLIDMVSLRVTSLVAMAGSIFMKRVRSLTYGVVFRDERYKDKRISNLIYHLQTGEKFEQLPNIQKPSALLRRVTDFAANMPTTLWFESESELPALICSGQATICYNLMKHIWREHGNDPELYNPETKELWMKLASDWDVFCREPYFLLSMLVPEIDLKYPPKNSEPLYTKKVRTLTIPEKLKRISKQLWGPT